MTDSSSALTSPFSVEARETTFSIMVVSIGMSCFIWQSIESGYMVYKIRKPVHMVVFAQAVLGVVVTFVTLLTSVVNVDCTFRLYFSIIGVNAADIALQAILLWKAYLGNNRSKVVLLIGTIPLLGIVSFIGLNATTGKSNSYFKEGACATDYPTFIVIVKATLDFCSNTFLSACFLFVIYRHYRVLGSSIQRTLIREGLIYCFGVCFSNILTGILLIYRVLGGFTPVIYTIDWYLASYLIIKQLKNSRNVEKEEETEFDGEGVVSDFSHHGCTTFDKERQLSNMPCSPLTDTTMVPTDSYQVR